MIVKLLKISLIFFSIFLLPNAYGQLLPSIGLNAVPSDNTPICNEAVFTGSYYTAGYAVNEYVNDFQLYSSTGTPLQLSTLLQQGKPVLLVSGSLTCPVFRAKIPVINQVAATYGSLINIAVIYTIEAHPTDTSVYFGYINITSQNTSEGIFFPSPATYGERKAMVDTLPSYASINAPVYIDGPCNEWWHAYGPAPNNAYIIDTDGRVLSKHGWFDRNPDDIFCNLDSLLNTTSNLCGTVGNGNFSINVVNTANIGMPGDILYDYVDIINPNITEVNIFIKKIETEIPLLWTTSFCADVCYGTHEDSIQLYLEPMDTMHFSLDFHTGNIADSGRVKVGFRNINNSNNSFSTWLSAGTYGSTGVNTIQANQVIYAYPNPFTSTINIQNNHPAYYYVLYNIVGQPVWQGNNINEHNFTNLTQGIYLLHTITQNKTQILRLFKE